MPDNYLYLFNSSFLLLRGAVTLQLPVEGGNSSKVQPNNKS